MSAGSAPSTPWLLRWQGILGDASEGPLGSRLSLIAGSVLCVLLAAMPFVTRAGLSLLILASGLLWLVWSLCLPAGRIGRISGWLLLMLGIAVLATGFSPVTPAAFKGLLKLISYLGVYALLRQLLEQAPLWWDRLVAALLGGELLSSVLAIRQLYGDTSELARWADPNSVADGTIRVYGPLENPNLLAGYLIPILPIALIALLRWRSWPQRLFAASALLLGCSALFLSYSRGGWLGMVAALGAAVLLLVLRQTRHWPPLWRRLFPLLLIAAAVCVLVIAVTQIEPLRIRVMSLAAGRGDSSNNFRINVWLAAIEMIQERPWLGIGPGNSAFNLIYPLYQQPKFNALSAYSVPLELLVEGGIPNLIAALGLLFASLRAGLSQLKGESNWALPALAAVAAIAGLCVQGATDTIFFRPEVQLTGWFCLATLSASSSDG
ncbi:IctB family putative bicarbonate transporter [Synechococcus sp. CB0205]|uniref:IctB family putative bicarbonate transporter n=1 Tax=Synechococcus sp. CB0205 TaxID=232363 RepID=UPI0002002B01|nr:IctB family putative bicarbonate transporter [Synechococcus sp. CB0205]